LLKKIPVVIQLRPNQIQQADLTKELKVDRFNLEKELREQPGKYMWWAALYSEASAKVEFLQEKLDQLEAKLFSKHVKIQERIADVKHQIALEPEYLKLRKRLRHWRDSERLLKFAEKAFLQHHSVLMALNANVRKEKTLS